MARIDDRTRTAFQDAFLSVLDSFTTSEIAEFEQMADNIRKIIKAAIERRQAKAWKN